MSVNRVILIGHLGADPESRAMPDGSAVCNFRMATSERWKDKATGESRELTEWHRVVLYRRLAEIATQYLQKGSQVYVEGKLRNRKWTDSQGAERYTTEIEATGLQMLGKAQSVRSDVSTQPVQQPPQYASSPGDYPDKHALKVRNVALDLDDDIPF